jgi:hypothetical protein
VPCNLVVYELVAAGPRGVDEVARLLQLHRDDVSLERLRSLLQEFSEALGDRTRMETL